MTAVGPTVHWIKTTKDGSLILVHKCSLWVGNYFLMQSDVVCGEIVHQYAICC